MTTLTLGTPPRALAVLGSYPPSRDPASANNLGLVDALDRLGLGSVSVVRVGQDAPVISDPRVVSQLRPSWQQSPTEALRALNSHDAVLVQQEFSGFGGEDGRDLLGVMEQIEVPVISTIQRVPALPTPSEHAILAEIASRSASMVVQSRTARERLIRRYEVDPASVSLIPRGGISPGRADLRYDPTRIITPGLLGPGKGVEWVIEALAFMTELIPAVRYVVVGPDVSSEAASYRRMVTHLAAARGISDRVILDDHYRSPAEMAVMIATSACVVLPYEDLRKETSSSLVDALSAGTPVIATAFDHAVELLTDGAGVIVQPGNPAELAAAIETVVTRTHLRNQMAQKAWQVSEQLSWTVIAEQYRQIIEQSLFQEPASMS
jgi:glycosyltransferase involved in cell wall biosynthesis